MKVYVMRHGPAGERGRSSADAERPLTEQGRAETDQAARGLKRLGVKPVAVLTSPLARAWQTAELVAARLLPGQSPAATNGLAAGAAPGEILNAVRGCEGDILIVGHDPDLSTVISYLLAGGTRPFIDFSKGGVVAIECPGPPERENGTLLWYLRRKQLAILGQ